MRRVFPIKLDLIVACMTEPPSPGPRNHETLPSSYTHMHDIATPSYPCPGNVSCELVFVAANFPVWKK